VISVSMQDFRKNIGSAEMELYASHNQSYTWSTQLRLSNAGNRLFC